MRLRVEEHPDGFESGIPCPEIGVLTVGLISRVQPTRRFLPALTKRSRPARGRAMHRPRRGVVATIEALAAGVPVASPWRELIGADLAVRRHDPAGLGDRLLALMQDRKIGHALRKRAEKEFSLDAFQTRLCALYDALLAPLRAQAAC